MVLPFLPAGRVVAQSTAKQTEQTAASYFRTRAAALLLCVIASACSTTEQSLQNGDATGPVLAPTRDASVSDSPQVMVPDPVSTPDSAVAASAFCAASRVLQEHCGSCHSDPPVAGAPMPLVQPSDLLAASPYLPERKVLELVRARIHDARRPMPPQGTLRDDVLAPLEAWLAADPAAQAASTACAELGPRPMPPPWPADCEKIYTIRSHDPDDPSKPFRVPAGAEFVGGVSVDPPWGNVPVQALMIRPLIDNAKVVHHWVLASGAPDSNFGNWLWGWAPGGTSSTELPDDVGMYIPAGLINLDMHYYNTGKTDELDSSGLEICVTTKFRKHTASMNMDFNAFPLALPPQRSQASGECRVITTTEEDIHVLALLPHMHKLGTHMSVSVLHDGVETVLHDAPFNFTEQRLHPQKDVIIHNGDVVRTRCTYTNDTNKLVFSWESSDQEMCVSFALHWPMLEYFCLSL
jgi:mono/diheme cytochrome c family protein